MHFGKIKTGQSATDFSFKANACKLMNNWKKRNPALFLPLKIKDYHKTDVFPGAFLPGACYSLTACKALQRWRSTTSFLGKRSIPWRAHFAKAPNVISSLRARLSLPTYSNKQNQTKSLAGWNRSGTSQLFPSSFAFNWMIHSRDSTEKHIIKWKLAHHLIHL